MLVPRCKQCLDGDSVTEIDLCLTICSDGGNGEKAARLLSYFLPQCDVRAVKENAVISAVTVPSVSQPEEYRLTVQNGSVSIEYCDYAGLRNALAAFSLSVRIRDGRLFLYDVTIEDFPTLSHRGVMLDLARGVKDFHLLIQDIILAAKARFNILHLHLSDSSGVCMELDSLPAECRLPNAYTKEQIKTLCEIADTLGLEIIPEFDMPAHSDKLVSVFPFLRCDADVSEPQSPYVVCTGTEQAYEIYEAVIREIADIFPGRYFHVGGDELEFSDVPHLGALCYWDNCKKCKALRKANGIVDRQEQYYYFINRIYETVKQAGKIMIMWSDQIDCTREPKLPNDIVMQFWRVAAEGRGPHDGCSLNGQLEMGYTVINSYYSEAYLDEERYLSSEKLAKWQIANDPQCEEAYAPQIIGSELCLWEYGNKTGVYSHYDRTAPSGIVLMGDKLWNHDLIEYTEEFAAGLTRTVLGAGIPENFNVFAALGDVLPPRSEAPAYPENVILTDEKLLETLEALSTKEFFSSGDANRASIYADCVRYVLKERAK